MRCSWRLVPAILAFLSLISAAWAQDYPNRPVRIIVGQPPGTGVDVAARLIARNLSESLGQQFVVENRPGASGNIGAGIVAHAPNDGYVLGAIPSSIVVNAALSTKLGFDFPKDFVPVALMTRPPLVLAATPSLNVSTVQELIARAKSSPDPIFFGSSGVGTTLHLSGELFNLKAGTKLVHVPYAGSSQAMADLLAGRIHLVFSPASTVMPSVDAGKLRALAVMTPTRSALIPNIPTMAEAGLPGVVMTIWDGVVAPARTSSVVVDRLARAIDAAMNSAEVRDALRRMGADPGGGNPKDFSEEIERSAERLKALVDTLGLAKDR